jgi:hypothetical protein
MRQVLWVSGLVLVLAVASVRADIDCDHVDDALTTGVAAGSFVTASAGTIMYWIKVQSTAAEAFTCWPGENMTGDTGGYLALGRQNNANFCGYVYDGESRFTEAPSPVGWSHLAVKFASGVLSLYVNGVLSSSISSIGTISDLSNPIRLCVGAGDPGWSGDRASEVKYYNVPVPDAEIETQGKSRLRTAGRTPPTAYWPLQDCADGTSGNGVTFADRSGQGRPATGNAGANTTGLTCRASEHLSHPWGIQ